MTFVTRVRLRSFQAQCCSVLDKSCIKTDFVLSRAEISNNWTRMKHISWLSSNPFIFFIFLFTCHFIYCTAVIYPPWQHLSASIALFCLKPIHLSPSQHHHPPDSAPPPTCFSTTTHLPQHHHHPASAPPPTYVISCSSASALPGRDDL